MNVLIGVSGGIAAYKAADLVSRLVGRGHGVRVVMTAGATRFVGPITFEALSGHPVMLDALATAAADPTSSVEHVAWAKWTDVALVAPMTANTLARLACGLADDALSTVMLALPARVPCLVAPAMNTAMWEHPAVVRNLRWLRELDRYEVIPPVSKRLACGDVGMGGLADVDTLVDAVEAAAQRVSPGAPSAP
ncbi:MAG: phosphopantothenoylcysteine decarboxylase [Alphaproteobacteria bacterium]|nr:phosphopantothenoylcysteine decarboxylase [Alphaproteobacteria bacterium]MCB9698320.1 phosphopantothenoylcysteine decarboxylase [Alphaproteobacteria bacterium]